MHPELAKAVFLLSGWLIKGRWGEPFGLYCRGLLKGFPGASATYRVDNDKGPCLQGVQLGVRVGMPSLRN